MEEGLNVGDVCRDGAVGGEVGDRRGCVGVLEGVGGVCFVQCEVLVRSVVLVVRFQVCRVYVDRRSFQCCMTARMMNLGRC